MTQLNNETELDEKIEMALIDSIVAVGVREGSTITDLDTLIIDRQKAINSIMSLIANHDREVQLVEIHKTMEAWHGTDDKQFADIMNIRIKELENNHE